MALLLAQRGRDLGASRDRLAEAGAAVMLGDHDDARIVEWIGALAQ